MRILVTGAAGSIGRTLVPGLMAAGHQVIGFDRQGAPDDGSTTAWYTGDCADPSVVGPVFAAENLDAVVHLAGYPAEQSLPEALTSHVVTTAALLDAMVGHDVRRIVFASSNHAVGRTPHEGFTPASPMPVGVRARPDTFYGVGKVSAEALLSLYADRYRIDAIACRIGSFLDRPDSVRALSTWLSPEDCVRLFAAALSAPTPGFAVLYGISANTRAWWDLGPGRALGYEPQDDAEDHAAGIPISEEPGAPTADTDAHVGGPFTSVQHYRPALG